MEIPETLSLAGNSYLRVPHLIPAMPADPSHARLVVARKGPVRVVHGMCRPAKIAPPVVQLVAVDVVDDEPIALTEYQHMDVHPSRASVFASDGRHRIAVVFERPSISPDRRNIALVD
jgi:hypothetical protein